MTDAPTTGSALIVEIVIAAGGFGGFSAAVATLISKRRSDAEAGKATAEGGKADAEADSATATAAASIVQSATFLLQPMQSQMQILASQVLTLQQQAADRDVRDAERERRDLERDRRDAHRDRRDRAWMHALEVHSEWDVVAIKRLAEAQIVMPPAPPLHIDDQTDIP